MRIALVLLVYCTLASCSDNQSGLEVISRPAPTIITIEKLALEHENLVGEEVMVEGLLRATSADGYFLSQRSRSEAPVFVRDFHMFLRFTENNVSTDKMARCLDATVLVTGVVEDSKQIRVSFINLEEIRGQNSDNCYAIYDI